MFGGGAILEQRLLGSPHCSLAGDLAQRAAFLADQRAVADREALQLAAGLVTPAFAAATQEFTASAACAALWEAEGAALTRYGFPVEPFVVDAAAEYADPDRVGDAALQRLKAAPEAIGNGGSPSPPRLAITLGASRLLPEQAIQLAAFLKGPHGKEWLSVRTQAFARSQEQFRAVRDLAEQRGFLRARVEQEDLVLPRATFGAEEAIERQARVHGGGFSRDVLLVGITGRMATTTSMVLPVLHPIPDSTPWTSASIPKVPR